MDIHSVFGYPSFRICGAFTNTPLQFTVFGENLLFSVAGNLDIHCIQGALIPILGLKNIFCENICIEVAPMDGASPDFICAIPPHFASIPFTATGYKTIKAYAGALSSITGPLIKVASGNILAELNKFLIWELVDISNGDVARVKNFYPSNNYILLFDCVSNNPYIVAPGMTITGRSSKMQATLLTVDHSVPENGMLYESTGNSYDWQVNFDKLIISDLGGAVVLDEIYNMYPQETMEYTYGALSTGKFTILDCNLDECIQLD